MKICSRFHIKKPKKPYKKPFEVCTLETCEKFVHKHLEKKKYVKN